MYCTVLYCTVLSDLFRPRIPPGRYFLREVEDSRPYYLTNLSNEHILEPGHLTQKKVERKRICSDIVDPACKRSTLIREREARCGISSKLIRRNRKKRKSKAKLKKEKERSISNWQISKLLPISHSSHSSKYAILTGLYSRRYTSKRSSI